LIAGALLPAHLVLVAPFPRVTMQTAHVVRIARGVDYGEYRLWTAAGPVRLHAIAIDSHDATIRVGTVLANGVLGPSPETISSMARRTEAIAGINGDYFDIGRTNHPTNIVVRNGVLVRTPRERYALAIDRSGAARFAEFSFSGSVQIGTQTFPLAGINTMPAEGAIALLTPAYGALTPHPNVALVPLVPVYPHAAPQFPATFRTASDAQVGDGQAPRYYLAEHIADPPASDVNDIGETVVVNGALTPMPLDDIATAIGGGPLVLRDGRWYDDPDGPKVDMRRPAAQSGAGIAPNGTLLLVEVDGAQPNLSIGVTHPQLAALLHALGARDGIAFDSGGSSEMAVQLPGETIASLVTSPSDGHERRVADGIFVYDTAPAGPAVALAADPDAIRAVPGADVTLHVTAIDATGRALREADDSEVSVEPRELGRVENGHFIALRLGEGSIVIEHGDLRGRIPVHVDGTPARLLVLPQNPNLDAGGTLAFQARAFDAEGDDIALPRELAWSTTTGTIDVDGVLVAGNTSGQVSVAIGSQRWSVPVTVGHHGEPLRIAQAPTFLTFPRGGAGDASSDTSCSGCIALRYEIGEHEEEAYAVVQTQMPEQSIGLEFDVESDGDGGLLRLALRNGMSEQILLSATDLAHPGRRHVVVHFPVGILDPVRLVGFYVIGTKENTAPAGVVKISNVRALVAGP
jgi:exopolysaccharide biosynthesis protein